jgi:GAF domain-containing protein/HAMP domain-containing protein
MLLGIRWGSLRTKIIAWSFVPTAIILVAVAVVIFYAYQDVTEDLVIGRNRELVRLTAIQLTTELRGYTDLLNAVTRTSNIYGNDPAARRDALKAASNRLVVFDAGVLILDTFGKVVAAEPERPKVLGQDWSDRAYYRQMLRFQIFGSPGPVFSDIVADGPGGAEVIVVAVPIIGPQGEYAGTMAGMFRVGGTAVSAWYANTARLLAGESGSAYLVDGNGRLIYHTDANRMADDVSAQPTVLQVLSGLVDAIRTRDINGQEIVASFAPVPGTSYGLVTQESWAALISPSQGYQRFLLLLLALGVVVPAVVVAVGVRRITRPIAELISAAQKVAGGNFGQAITAQTGDEVEELAEQFNLMSAQLQESYTHLEQRVADRTKELATINAIAAVVSQSLDLDEILNDALDKTLQVMEIEAGGIYLLDEKAGLLSIAAQKGFSPQFVAEIDRLKLDEGFSGHVVQSGQPLVVRDVSMDPRLSRTAVKDEGLRSLAIAPLCSRRKVLGTMFATTHGYQDFTDQDVQLLTSIGHQIGIAVENARLFNAVQRRAEQFGVISEVGRRLTSILAIDELLDQIVRLIQKAFNYAIVEIGLIEEDELVFKARAEGNSVIPFESFRLKVGKEGITGWVAATGEPLLLPDVSQDPRYIQITDSVVFRSELAVPIKTKGKVIGVLNVQSEQLNAFDESDLTVMQSLADQAAIAIENARLFRAEQRRAEQFRVIGEVGSRITSILAVNELLSQMARLIQQAFNYYHVGIGLIEGDEVIYRVGAGVLWDDPYFQFEPSRLKVGTEGITGWVAATGKLLLVPDVSKEPRYVWMRGSETRSELTVPIKAKGEVIGVLDVQSDHLNAFDESDLAVLQSLAHQAAIVIENARLFAERERRLDEMAVLNEVGQALSSTLRLDELLDLIHRQVSRVMDTTNLYIAFYDKDEDWVSFPLYVEGGQISRDSGARKAGRGLTEHIIRNRQPLLLPDNVEGRMQELGIKSIGTAAKSWLGVPMIAGDEVLGVIAVQSYTTENVYDEGHLSLLPTIAAQAAIAIENARLYEDAQQAAVLEERNRLARELHDAVTQTLFSASLIAETLPPLWESDQDEGRELLKELRQLSRGALAEMRTLLLELRPAALAEASLADLLHQLGEAVTGRTGLPVTVTVEGEGALPSDVHVALYRMAQEALNNVVKHARASQVVVSLSYARPLFPPQAEGMPTGQGGTVELYVSDDGRGFDPSRIPPESMGLNIIRERAQAIGARLTVESEIGRGTKVTVVWPEL